MAYDLFGGRRNSSMFGLVWSQLTERASCRAHSTMIACDRLTQLVSDSLSGFAMLKQFVLQVATSIPVDRFCHQFRVARAGAHRNPEAVQNSTLPCPFRPHRFTKDLLPK